MEEKAAKKKAAAKRAVKKSAPKALSADFKKHLEKIRGAKTDADRVIEKISPAHATAQAVLKSAWEALFDFFCQSASDEVSLADLNTLSGVIYKLSASNAQMKNLELKHAKSDSENEGGGGEITPELISKIEEKLRLL